MVGLAGTTLAVEEREILCHPLVGGALLFERNYESPEQVAALCATIHALREPRLLIAVDHEGGRVQRFRRGFTPLPAAAVWGRLYDRDPGQALEMARDCGWLMAAELRAVGVDLSFAPVLDLDRGVSRVIGERALHRDPETVATLARAYGRGMKEAGMTVTGKHFPGHGGVREDSHLQLPVDSRGLEDLLLEDLLPFERMVHYGMESVMTAHVCYQGSDRRIATFSSFWIEEVLRGQLGFQGAVFSDDLAMAAAAGPGDLAARARAALAAGCDMVLVCQERAHAEVVLDDLGSWSNPVTRLRLARLHGRPAPTRDELLRDPRWRETAARVSACDRSRDLKLL